MDFGDPVGYSPGYRRPAAIASSDDFNRSGLSTAIVAAITSSTRTTSTPGNVLLPLGLLPKASVISATQPCCVDRTQHEEKITELPFVEQRQLDERPRLVLGL